MKAIIITVAYNAEKTIQRTIESILAQSHSDFVYYIVDNGSIDHTGEIIRKYAQTDSRIAVISKPDNSIWAFFEILPDILKEHDKSDYLCSIDADDTYNPDFLEKMLAFMERERLDIAACGNDFIDSATGRISGVRKLDNNLILDGYGFGKYFPLYHQFMRTVWAKIYSLSILLEDKFEPRYEMGYGGDTVFAIEAFRRANRVGILAESLHQYYVINKSASFQYNEKRIVSDRVLYDIACNFLISKVGNISKQNADFLLVVYFHAIIDTLNVLLKARINVVNKLCDLRDIFQSQQTQKLIQWSGTGAEKKELFGRVAGWVLSQKEARNGAGMEITADILAAMEIYPSQISGWHDCRVFNLLTKIKHRMPKTKPSDNVDAQIVSLTSKLPLLAGLDVGFLTFFHEIVFSILQHDEQKALKQIKDTISKETDIPDEYAEAFLTLGLNLSAMLNYSGDFIYFKKLQISSLIDLSRTDDARKALADWNNILPDDMDFKEFRAKLTQ